jgi:hypothetical protein
MRFRGMQESEANRRENLFYRVAGGGRPRMESEGMEDRGQNQKTNIHLTHRQLACIRNPD